MIDSGAFCDGCKILQPQATLVFVDAECGRALMIAAGTTGSSRALEFSRLLHRPLTRVVPARYYTWLLGTTNAITVKKNSATVLTTCILAISFA